MEQLGAAAAAAAERLPRATAERLAAELLAGAPLSSLRRLVPTSAFAAVIAELATATPGRPPEVVGAALLGAAKALEASRARTTELVWTGPPTDHVPVRMSAQALRQVIDAANDRLIVASFAVYRVDLVADALIRAHGRGARVDLIVESATESGGALSFDGIGGLGGEALAACRVLTWPAAKRPAENGRRAALHAKFAVADGRLLLVTSANLTGHALSLNMELGLLVAGGDAPAAAVRLVDDLIADGNLAPFPSHAGADAASLVFRHGVRLSVPPSSGRRPARGH